MPYAGQVTEVQIPDGTIWEIPSGGGSSVEPATQTPLMDGTGAVGVSAKYAREDHVHPSDTSKQDTLVSGTNIKTINGVSVLGSGDIVTPDTTVDPATNAPLMDGTAAVGNSTKYARENHRHPTDTSRAPVATVSTHNISNVNVANAVDTTIGNTGAQSAGIYLVIVHVSFASNTNGRRRAWLSSSNTGQEVDRYSQVVISPASSAATQITFTVQHTLTANTTWYLRVYQNSGGTLAVGGGIRVVKIG